MSKSAITIINNSNVRGVIAPSATLSESVLRDVIDIIELAHPKSVARINKKFNGKRLIDGRTLRKKLGV